MGNLLYICICILFRKLKYFTNINTTRPVDFLAVQAGSQEAVASRHTQIERERHAACAEAGCCLGDDVT